MILYLPAVDSNSDFSEVWFRGRNLVVKMSSFKSNRKRRLSSDSSFLNASPASSVKSSREMAVHDELKLLNEQLQDELNTCQDELSR